MAKVVIKKAKLCQIEYNFVFGVNTKSWVGSGLVNTSRFEPIAFRLAWNPQFVGFSCLCWVGELEDTTQWDFGNCEQSRRLIGFWVWGLLHNSFLKPLLLLISMRICRRPEVACGVISGRPTEDTGTKPYHVVKCHCRSFLLKDRKSDERTVFYATRLPRFG